MDFDRVIARWPKAESAAAAWQRAAQIYAGRQDMANMAKYYEGLIQNFPKASPAALAEAHFLLGRAAFDQGDFKSSISHMAEAKTLDPQKYGDEGSGNGGQVYDLGYAERRASECEEGDLA